MQSIYIENLFKDIRIGTEEEQFIYYGIVKSYLSDEDFMNLMNHCHHKQIDRLTHSLRVSYLCFITAYRHKMDYVSVAIGGLLHDFCLFGKGDYRVKKITDIWCFYHPKEALKKAESKYVLSDISKDMIQKHMFPMVTSFPKHKETYLIAYWDKYCAIKEYCQKKPKPIIKKAWFLV